MQQLSFIITASVVGFFGTIKLYGHPGSSNNERINLQTGDVVYGLSWPGNLVSNLETKEAVEKKRDCLRLI